MRSENYTVAPLYVQLAKGKVIELSAYFLVQTELSVLAI